VLVWHDLLGLYSGRAPRFVKRYAEVADVIGDAVSQYAADVRGGSFPEDVHTYAMPDDQREIFEAALQERQR
jgi:3-methyl-2-oxobutanoate hydroxymethyltransferase